MHSIFPLKCSRELTKIKGASVQNKNQWGGAFLDGGGEILTLLMKVASSSRRVVVPSLSMMFLGVHLLQGNVFREHNGTDKVCFCCSDPTQWDSFHCQMMIVSLAMEWCPWALTWLIWLVLFLLAAGMTERNCIGRNGLSTVKGAVQFVTHCPALLSGARKISELGLQACWYMWRAWKAWLGSVMQCGSCSLASPWAKTGRQCVAGSWTNPFLSGKICCNHSSWTDYRWETGTDWLGICSLRHLV